MPKIVIVFNNTLRSDTTGIYCLSALKELLPDWDVEHVVPPTHPAELKDIKGDFFLKIDDGIMHHHVLPHPNAIWYIDLHIDWEDRYAAAELFDHIYCAQDWFVESLSKAGYKASWLPLGCDPMLHRAVRVREEYDVGFLGHINPTFMHRRIEFLDRMFKEFPSFMYKTAFGYQYPTEMSRARVCLNHSVNRDLNMRFFEALSMCRPLVTDRLDDIYKLGFKEGEDILTYADFDEAVSIVRELLSDEEKRTEYARKGHEKVRAGHTYRHRMQQVLDDFAGGKI